MTIQYADSGLPLLNQSQDDEFVDMSLAMVNLQHNDTHYRFDAVASHNDEEVGMEVIMVKGMAGGFDEEMNLVSEHVYNGGVVFRRSGKQSDRLVVAIAELYGYEASDLKMVTEESFTAIPLEQGDIDFATQSVRIKLFGHDDEPIEEEEYYESFFHVDIANRLVQWNEKDVEYRAALLSGMYDSSDPE